MIKCMSFDLWGTLIKGNPAYKAARTELLADYVEDRIPKDQINDIVEGVKNEFNTLMEKYGIQFPPQQILECALDTLGIPRCHHRYIRVRLNGIFVETPPVIIPNTLEVLNVLKEQYKIVLVSNTVLMSGTELYDALKPTGLWKVFDEVGFSDLHDCAKPSPMFFTNVYKAAGVHPNEVVHIGDNPHTDGSIVRIGGTFRHINGNSGNTIKSIEVEYGNSVLS